MKHEEAQTPSSTSDIYPSMYEIPRHAQWWDSILSSADDCVTFSVHHDRPVIKLFVIQAICKFENCVEMLQWLQAPASANKIQRSV
jgi:hypothetical protein